LYVLDAGNNRVKHVSAQGEVLNMWGGDGTAPGRFREPGGLDVAPDGTVVVADTGNRRVQRFTVDGRFLAAWGEAEPAPDSDPERGWNFNDIAAAPDGSLYIVDVGYREVRRYAADGQRLARWPANVACTGTTTATEPLIGLAADDLRATRPMTEWLVTRMLLDVAPDGTVFVAPFGRVLHFGADGECLRVIARDGISPGRIQLPGPGGLSAAPNGDVLVADSGGGRIQRFARDGRLMAFWTVPGEPTDVTLAPDGLVYTTLGVPTSSRSHDTDVVERYTEEGHRLERWGLDELSAALPTGPDGVGVAPDGSVYTLDQASGRLQHYTYEGAFLGYRLAPGSARGQVRHPGGLDFTPEGHMLLADTGNQRVQVFTPAGASYATWGVAGDGPGELGEPTDVAFADWGYGRRMAQVSDARNHRVAMTYFTGGVLNDYAPENTGTIWQPTAVTNDLTDRGLRLVVVDRPARQLWLSAGYEWLAVAGPNVLTDPTDVTIKGSAPNSEVIVTDAGADDLAVFDRVGTLLRRIGGPGTAPGRFHAPIGIAAAPDDTLAVADRGNRRVQRIDVTGAVKALWPVLDGRDGRFRSAGDVQDVAFLPDGGLVVAACDAGELQWFDADGRFVRRSALPPAPGTDYTCAYHVAPAADGSVWATNISGQRLEQFDADGKHVAGFVTSDVEYRYVRGLAVTADGDPVALMEDPYEVVYFSPDGVVKAQWPVAVNGSTDLAIGQDGTVFVLTEEDLDSVYRYTPDGMQLSRWPTLAPDCSSRSLSVPPDGSVWVGCRDGVVIHLGPTGERLGEYDVGDGCTAQRGLYGSRLDSLAASADGRLALTSQSGRCVKVLGPSPAAWRVEFFGDRWLNERPLAITHTDNLSFDWGAASPAPPLVPPDGFSARAERVFVTNTAGGIALDLKASGGVRLWLDEALLVDDVMASGTDWSDTLPLGAGMHRLVLEYRDTGGAAELALTVALGVVPPTASPTPPPTVTPVPPAGRIWLPRVDVGYR
jgi:DNA-binding beta-propeller fold protein YncE